MRFNLPTGACQTPRSPQPPPGTAFSAGTPLPLPLSDRGEQTPPLHQPSTPTFRSLYPWPPNTSSSSVWALKKALSPSLTLVDLSKNSLETAPTSISSAPLHFYKLPLNHTANLRQPSPQKACPPTAAEARPPLLLAPPESLPSQTPDAECIKQIINCGWGGIFIKVERSRAREPSR